MFPGNSWHQTRRFARELDQAAMPYIAAIKAKFTDEEIAEMERARRAAMTVSIIAIGGYIAVAAAVMSAIKHFLF